jgi:hypothetical protein
MEIFLNLYLSSSFSTNANAEEMLNAVERQFSGHSHFQPIKLGK